MGFSKLIISLAFISVCIFSCSKEYIASNGTLEIEIDNEDFSSEYAYGQLYTDRNALGNHFQNRYIFGTRNPKNIGFNFKLELTSDLEDNSLQFSKAQLVHSTLSIFGEEYNSVYKYADGEATINRESGSRLRVRFTVSMENEILNRSKVVKGNFIISNIEQYEAEIEL